MLTGGGFCTTALWGCITVHCDNANEAYFGKGTKLTVLEQGIDITEPTVKVLGPSSKECKDRAKRRKKTLVCLASKFYPDHVGVTWKADGVDIETGVVTDEAVKRTDGFYNITSRLTLPAKQWFSPGRKFTCIVSFDNGTHIIKESASIISTDKDQGLTREKYLRITQKAKLSYVVLIMKGCIYGAFVCFLVWKLQGSAGKRNK